MKSKKLKVRKAVKKTKKATGSFKSPVIGGFVVPGLPHLVLAPEKNAGWKKVAQAMDKVRQEIERLNPDVIVMYSTYWPSVIGHQMQADPHPEWVLVDDQFHALGSIPYKLKMDTSFAQEYVKQCQEKGLQAREIAYKGFPIDTGSVVALKLINPNNKFPAAIVSSNVYSDRAETVVLGKAAREVLNKQNKKAVAVVITSLSNRLLSNTFNPKEDKIFSLKDSEWNNKVLEFLGDGRLEDVSQLSRQIHREARVQKVNNFKPFWWLSSFMGPSNRYKGQVYAYEAIQGTGACVVGLSPSEHAARDLEFDEDDPVKFAGERNVLAPSYKG